VAVKILGTVVSVPAGGPMCGIAGVIDLAGRHAAPRDTLRRMADAIAHRGPDDDGYLDLPHLGLANRRLSIVGLADGKQPIANEDRSVWCVFNGEFFEYPEKRRELEAKGIASARIPILNCCPISGRTTAKACSTT
jgi:asparagine synthetase B (glutamine-hydrolysing)